MTNMIQKNLIFFQLLLQKVLTAKRKKIKKITLMGTGRAMREIMYADDLGEACFIFLKKKQNIF